MGELKRKLDHRLHLLQVKNPGLAPEPSSQLDRRYCINVTSDTALLGEEPAGGHSNEGGVIPPEGDKVLI